MWRITVDRSKDYATGYLLRFPYFKKNWKMTTMDLHEIIPDQMAIQQFNFT